ncbi:hypothetical protein CDAR_407961 [Caerostris darwini]|uniref:Uncharacterized protein n=1 Tax=Caerostris darwini TaxID=1538125 RepID=A0AAV4PYN4_9ARAC|nr:hypothetical protein CDAR_407961 [Caerostris darwini]
MPSIIPTVEVQGKWREFYHGKGRGELSLGLSIKNGDLNGETARFHCRSFPTRVIEIREKKSREKKIGEKICDQNKSGPRSIHNPHGRSLRKMEWILSLRGRGELSLGLSIKNAARFHCRSFPTRVIEIREKKREKRLERKICDQNKSGPHSIHNPHGGSLRKME